MSRIIQQKSTLTAEMIDAIRLSFDRKRKACNDEEKGPTPLPRKKILDTKPILPSPQKSPKQKEHQKISPNSNKSVNRKVYECPSCLSIFNEITTLGTHQKHKCFRTCLFKCRNVFKKSIFHIFKSNQFLKKLRMSIERMWISLPDQRNLRQTHPTES